MKSKHFFDSKLRSAFTKKEVARIVLKYLYSKYSKSLNFQKYYVRKYSSSVAKTKLVRRCILNNRARGVIRTFGVSRIVLKEYLLAGYMPGYKKAVW